MPRTRKPPVNDPGPFARMLLAARHKAGKNIAACAKECGLSRTFLTMIEIGKRCPELERVPAIGLAYQANVSELCWAWVCQWAPAAVRYLSLSVDLDLVPTIVDYFHNQWVKRQAEAAAAADITVAELQAARMQAVLDKPMPVIEPFERHVGYRFSESDPQKSTVTSRGGVVDASGTGKRRQ